MKNNRADILLLAGAAVVGLGLALFLLRQPGVGRTLVEFDAKFSRILAGDTERAALALLGDPDSKVHDFMPSDSGPQYHLYWFRGEGFFYSVGIDRRGRVVEKDSGGL